MEKFWIIFVEHTDGGRHYRHATSEDACKEAERLARLPHNRGRGVYVFECVASCRAGESPVTWETSEKHEESVWGRGRQHYGVGGGI